ncbi:MAG TPA: glycine zipper 2TM domain-containing protein [Rhizomicrobium sp.]|nr:glycine zipper 2TM domain-containing protein [Rhizomicrobium sp.]
MRRVLSAAILAGLFIPVLPAWADPPPWAPAHGRRAKEAERAYREDERAYREDEHAYRKDERKHERHLVRYEERIWRGDDGRVYCHRSDGTTGLIVGAVAGGVIGNRLARGQSAALGTILGAGAGALIGQAIEKNAVYCE